MMSRRLIVVARDEPDLFDYIRRDQFGDDNVVVISDRRLGDRRAGRDRRTTPRGSAHDRRRTDRRQCDIADLLRVNGWGEVLLSEA
ncbi:MAG TPA: hypothetical protein VFW70_18840 [Methylomirabilota bacterium]|jgi:hypothetical protein|nr:hypothetical protein [Methylomirabilota bacterium]